MDKSKILIQYRYSIMDILKCADRKYVIALYILYGFLTIAFLVMIIDILYTSLNTNKWDIYEIINLIISFIIFTLFPNYKFKIKFYKEGFNIHFQNYIYTKLAEYRIEGNKILNLYNKKHNPCISIYLNENKNKVIKLLKSNNIKEKK